MPDEFRAFNEGPLPQGVTVHHDATGLTYLNVSTRAATARLYPHGAHVTHFQPTGSAPVLFTSERSSFQPGKPIRGGVPIVFPWFGPHPSDSTQPAHGWARTTIWQLADVTADADDTVSVTFSLVAHGFAMRYAVRVGRILELELQTHNRQQSAATVEQALHTYLAVGDVRLARIEGLAGRSYLDKMDAGRRKTQSGPITFGGETDRVYVDTADEVIVHDPGLGRRVVVSKEGSLTTVVWNPWVEKARRMPDFGDDEWPRMLCIETANAAENAVTLPPDGRHLMRAKLRVE